MNEKTLDINTLCRDCVFATYETRQIGFLQIGCAVDRLEKFKEQNAATLETKAITSYFKLNRFCNFCRDKEWAKNRKNLIEDVTKETNISIGYLIIAKDNQEELKKSLDSILEQKIKPVRICVVFNSQGEHVKSFINSIKGIKTPIDVVNIIFEYELEDKIEYGCKKLYDSNFITVLDAGFELPKDFSSNLNKMINTDLRRFVMVNSNNYPNGFTIQTEICKLLETLEGDSIRQKIEVLAKNQDLEHMIIDYSEVAN